MSRLNPAVRRLLLSALPAVALIAASAAHAATFTSSALFNASTTGLTVEDYSSYAAGTLVPDGSSLGALTYSFSTGAGLGGVVTNVYNSFSGNSLAAKQVAGPLSNADFFYNNESVTVTFPTAVTAVGIFSNTNLPISASLSTASGGAVTVFTTYDTATFGFLGLTSSTPFTSATFTSSTYNIPEIEYGAAVPEPATWALMLIGVGGLGAGLRSRRKDAMIPA
jgi:hypothetical protein